MNSYKIVDRYAPMKFLINFLFIELFVVTPFDEDSTLVSIKTILEELSEFLCFRIIN